jgi:hypothetical protein
MLLSLTKIVYESGLMLGCCSCVRRLKIWEFGSNIRDLTLGLNATCWRRARDRMACCRVEDWGTAL